VGNLISTTGGGEAGSFGSPTVEASVIVLGAAVTCDETLVSGLADSTTGSPVDTGEAWAQEQSKAPATVDLIDLVGIDSLLEVFFRVMIAFLHFCKCTVSGLEFHWSL
jgi:hypothetical protein